MLDLHVMSCRDLWCKCAINTLSHYHIYNIFNSLILGRERNLEADQQPPHTVWPPSPCTPKWIKWNKGIHPSTGMAAEEPGIPWSFHKITAFRVKSDGNCLSVFTKINNELTKGAHSHLHWIMALKSVKVHC